MSGGISKWRRISIRNELVCEIEKLIKMGRYTSVAEFVSEAVRLRLEEVYKSVPLAALAAQQC